MRSNDCFVCKMVRMYLLVAAPLLLILGSLSISGGSSSIGKVAHVGLIDFLAYGAGGSLILIVLYRVYEEYWLVRKRNTKLEELISNQFDQES